MKVLVTGGAGFIGSEMCFQLVNLGHKVSVIDSLTYAGNFDSLNAIASEVSFTNLDLRDFNGINSYFARHSFDVVVNFAAETHVDNSIESPRIFIESNVMGTFNLLEQARKHDFKFLQISTDEVYGSIREGEFSEDYKLEPSSPYSASKASAELIINSYLKTFGVRASGVRCSNNYGPRQNSEKLIPAFIRKLTRGEKVPVYGTGKNIREWIHVSDSVSGIIQVMLEGRVGEYYNISSSEFYSNLEVTNLLLSFFDKDESCIEFVEDRKGHDFRYAINSEKIRSELGWSPKIAFSTGLVSTIEWYLQNPEYLKNERLEKL
jgi:dTDP-glucose 4,6-dehydratase